MNCGVGGPEQQELLYVNFNQDYTCLAVGTRKGFRIYNCEPFGKCYVREDGGAAGICEMLFSSSLVAIAGAGEPPTFSPRKLQIINTKRQTIVCELNFPTKVLSIAMNRKRLVVVLDTRIHIYDLSTMKIVHTIETLPNPQGVCALSANAENSLLAYPSDDKVGILQIVNCITLVPVCVIAAHRSAISRVAFNIDGTLLATASDKGTIIRVFNPLTGQKLHQLRRGAYPAVIYYLSFSLRSNFLCVTSDSDTAHIYRLQYSAPGGVEGGSNGTGNGTGRGSGGGIRSSLHLGGTMSAILPERMGEALESVRDFAHIKIPAAASPSSLSGSSRMQTICAITSVDGSANVMLVTSDGWFLLYALDMERGGECKLLRKHPFNLREDSVSSISAMSL